MKPVAVDDVPLAPAGEVGVVRAGDERRAGLRRRAAEVRQVFRQLFGIPDYERYLAHVAARHPGATVLSRREFCAQAIERKYGGSGPRCC